METIKNVSKSYTDPNTGKFVEGNPGGGRPKGQKNFTTKVREALEKIADGKDYTNEEAFVKSILKKAIVDGDVNMQKHIWDHLDGRPVQKQELTGKDGKDLPIPILGYVPNNNSDKEDSILEQAT